MKLRDILEAKNVTDADVVAAQKFFDEHPGMLADGEKKLKIKIFKEDGKLHARLLDSPYKYEDPDSDKWTRLTLDAKDITEFKIKLHEVMLFKIEGTSIKDLNNVEFPDFCHSIEIDKAPITSLKGIGKADGYTIRYENNLSLVGLPSSIEGQLSIGSKTATNIRDNPIRSCGHFWIGHMGNAVYDDDGQIIDDSDDVPAKFDSFEGFPSSTKFMAIMYWDAIKSYKDISKHVKQADQIAIRGIPRGCGLLGLIKLNTDKFVELEPMGGNYDEAEKLAEIFNKHLQEKDMAALIEDLHDAGLEEFAHL